MCPELTVVLGWLFEKVSLDPIIQLNYVDTKKLPDMLTGGNFTRDEWRHLLHNFSMSSCSHFTNFLSDPITQC